MIYPLYENFMHVKIKIDDVFFAQQKDKKNTSNKVNLILPVGDEIKKVSFENKKEFWKDLNISFKKVLNCVE